MRCFCGFQELRMLDAYKVKHRTVEAGGASLFYREAGVPDAPALLLLHGFPSSSHIFRNIIEPLAEVARVVAPDMPGFGFTEAPDDYAYGFETIGRTIDAFTAAVGIERFFLYVHDFGAPVAYHLALTHPDRILGLIVQNGSSHAEGHGESWDGVRTYLDNPTPENRAALPEWMNFDGVRDQYVGEGIPERVKPLFAPEYWHVDWERLRRPGLTDIQFRIFTDYAWHMARFEKISTYHREHQPPALVLWGRHDRYYAIEEILAYHRELDRLSVHIFDSGHQLLETHSPECAALIREFILNVTIRGDERASLSHRL
jgi:pimeloyl-ACP methyl ester carboxylesterase